MTGLESVYYVTQILASVAVLISLIYVGLQLRNSNLIAQDEARQRTVESVNEQLSALISNPESVGWWTGYNMSQESKYKASIWLVMALRSREYAWFAYRNGLIDEASFEAYSSAIPIIHGAERLRRWWHARKNRGEFHPGFVAFVDEKLRSAPVDGAFS